METTNWADEIGRKVYLSLAAGMLKRRHTTGNIVRLTKTLVIVKVDGEDREVRFCRFGQIPTHGSRTEYGSGAYNNRAMMSRDNYMEGK